MPSCEFCKSEASNLQRCSVCQNTLYCSRNCQVAHWKVHKPNCTPQDGAGGSIPKSVASLASSSSTAGIDSNVVWGVKILHNGAAGPVHERFLTEHFTPSHPIFKRGELCPFPVLYGIPIIIYSARVHSNQPARNDNQPAIYLRIEPKDGFAPADWQLDYVGDCYFVRKDRQPLSKELLETMYSYHSSLLHSTYFEEILNGRQLPGHDISPQAFKKFSDDYWKEEKKNGRTTLLESDGR